MSQVSVLWMLEPLEEQISSLHFVYRVTLECGRFLVKSWGDFESLQESVYGALFSSMRIDTYIIHMWRKASKHYTYKIWKYADDISVLWLLIQWCCYSHCEKGKSRDPTFLNFWSVYLYKACWDHTVCYHFHCHTIACLSCVVSTRSTTAVICKPRHYHVIYHCT